MVWSPCLNLSWLADEARGIPDLTFAFSKMTSYSFLSRPIPETLDILSKRFLEFSRRMNDRFDLPNTITNMRAYAKDHPLFSVLLATVAIMFSLLVLAFVSFVVTTLGFTFIGFLFVEGTLLTIGTFFLSGILFVVGFLALGFSAFIAAIWFLVNKTFNVLTAVSDKISSGQTHLAIKPTIGNGLHHYD